MGGDISGWSARPIEPITTNETFITKSRHRPLALKTQKFTNKKDQKNQRNNSNLGSEKVKQKKLTN
jgi:hypothetical protein